MRLQKNIKLTKLIEIDSTGFSSWVVSVHYLSTSFGNSVDKSISVLASVRLKSIMMIKDVLSGGGVPTSLT